MVAFGMACERPALAVSSSRRNSRLTVMWSRRRSAVSGSTSSRAERPDARAGQAQFGRPERLEYVSARSARLAWGRRREGHGRSGWRLG